MIERAGAPADQKTWITGPGAASLTHYIVNDTNTVSARWLVVERSGAVVTALRFFMGPDLQCAVIDADGNLAVGDGSPGYHRFRKSRGEGQTILDLVTPTNQSCSFYEVEGTGVGALPSAAKFQRHSVNGRSVNTAGTVNATGLDYAEYMEKREDCGPIAKGQIAGVDGDGRLTDRFDLAHSFVVKSTSPSYVGGDVLTEVRVGLPPPEPLAADDEDEAVSAARRDAWAADMAAWQERVEAERARFDRIAFCGQVPVAVTGPWSVGDYVLAAPAPDGGIEAIAVGAVDLGADGYRRAVGRVWRRDGDGRPVIAVKVV